MVENIAADYYAQWDSTVRTLVDYPAAERRERWARDLRHHQNHRPTPLWHAPARWLGDRLVSAGEWLRPPACESGMTHSSR